MTKHKAQARWIAFLAAIALALYLCWLMLKPFVGVLEWATVLVIVFYPIHKRLATRIKRPNLTALISCFLVVLVIILPLAVLTIATADELAAIVPELPARLSHLLNTQAPVIGGFLRRLEARVGTLNSQQFLIDQLERSGDYLLALLLGLMRNFVTGVAKAFFIIFTMFFFFRDGDQIVRALRSMLPLTQDQSEAIFVRTREVVSASVYGVVAIAIIQGFLGGVAFWMLGVPSPILWAVLMTFVCMIPVSGSFMVWLPLSIYLILNNHWTKAILLLTWGALVVSTIDNFLRPRLIRNQTRLHELLVFFSVLGGMSLFGVVGVVLGPVVLAITLGLLDALQHPGTERTS